MSDICYYQFIFFKRATVHQSTDNVNRLGPVTLSCRILALHVILQSLWRQALRKIFRGACNQRPSICLSWSSSWKASARSPRSKSSPPSQMWHPPLTHLDPHGATTAWSREYALHRTGASRTVFLQFFYLLRFNVYSFSQVVLFWKWNPYFTDWQSEWCPGRKCLSLLQIVRVGPATVR